MEDSKNDQMSEMAIRGQTRLSNAASNQLTRDCLREAMLILLEKKSLDEITITELVKKAGVSAMAFYRNYKSKLDIVQEIADAISSELDRLYHESQHVSDARAWLIDVFKWAQANQQKLLLIAKAHIPPEVNLQAMLKYLVPKTHGKPFYAQLAVEGAFSLFLGGWLDHGAVETPEEIADIFMAFWSTGIVANIPQA